MSQAPLVTVVMPFLDTERFIAEAIESVLAQSHRALELILVDDGSSDGSRAIADSYAEKDPRVLVLEHPGHINLGIGASHALAVQKSAGDLTAFLDADDVWEAVHLEHEVGLLAAHPEAGAVCGRAVRWYGWDPTTSETDWWGPLPFAPGTVVPSPRMLTATLRRGQFTTPVCNLLVRTELLRDLDLSAGDCGTMYEDQLMLAEIHLRASSVVSGSLTARYRQHASSTTAAALRNGTYHPVHQHSTRAAWLAWLQQRIEGDPAGDDPGLREALAAARVECDRPVSARTRLERRVRREVHNRVPDRMRIAARDRLSRLRTPRPGHVRLGTLRRSSPLSREMGFDRGTPIDRAYIDHFLGEHAEDISGRVLEIGDSTYTRRFGGDQVRQADVLNVAAGAAGTTFVGDLEDAPALPDAAFDCVVLTQTLQYVYDLPAAVRTLHRILRPGGVVLATVPGISPISQDPWSERWCWAMTPTAARRLFGDVFGRGQVEVRAHGNVLSSIGLLAGLAVEELPAGKLVFSDPQFPMLVTVRAFRAVGPAAPVKA